MNTYRLISVCLALAGLLFAPLSHAQDATGDAKTVESKRTAAIERGLKYLAEQGQAEDGTFTAKAGSGLTSLAVLSALRNGKSVDDPMVAKGLKAIEKFVQPDGGIYGGGRLKNYETCIAIIALVEANKTVAIPRRSRSREVREGDAVWQRW